MRLILLLLGVAFLSGCNLPRGAALQSEVISAANKDDAPFAVYPVTRDTVDTFASWPRWHGYQSWAGSTRGPASPVIRAGDFLDLVIWDNSDNSLLLPPGGRVVDMKGIQVSPDGSIFVPYLEKLYVNGKSPDSARALIQERIGEILPSAQVQLVYTAGASSSVSLVGGVQQPGTFPLPDRNFSVLKLISQGGGVSPTMRNPQVKLVRDGKTHLTSLTRLYDDASLDVILRGGDKVIVEQDNRYFQALGSAGREDLVYFTKDSINALEAVSIIGGLDDDRANPKGVLILREYATSDVRTDGRGPKRTDVVFTIDMTNADGLFSARRFLVEPKDVILVTESPITNARTIFLLVGSIVGVVNAAQNLSN